ncbi:hypothetical protein [Streptomyces pacificus]|uniref:Uncharacterized protein n=1 Tax=Streptomyces pacificus TaxID=2705029 RepID=A0A6A0AUK4_9ACTN|nr:hypothetical protein [Streptomyces pacificus]GFH36592.1 hypothetical protein SCWH03_28230 [Streptomyces pacificus]
MITTADDPTTLAPTTDRAPVELAIVSSIASTEPPETFLWITFHKPCGGATIRYEWTHGGTALGDHIDALAMAIGLDAADWMHITSEHAQTTTRGRIEIQAHPLRPILADVQAHVRCPDDRREGLHRILDKAAETTGTAPTRIPRWVGVGPALLGRNA